MLWIQQRFLTLVGNPIKNGQQLKELARVPGLPKEAATTKVGAHVKGDNMEAKRNV